ncbi:MAG: nucleotidyltransferase domain-containing protein [Thermoproteus sp.]|nr:nucleotidyltransferase domain-containing protein [Thermoproteus sp.]
MLFRRLFVEETKEIAAWIRALCEAGYLVVLFGSRARGEARIDSDWDLLVVGEAPPPEPPNDLAQVVYLRQEEVEGEIERFNTLAVDAFYEGKLVCGPQELFQRWRELVRRRTAGYIKTRDGWFKAG